MTGKSFSFYLASSLGNAEFVEAVAQALEARGGWCSFAWWRQETVRAGSSSEAQGARARADADGVVDADLLILILPARHGGHFETGLAVGLIVAGRKGRHWRRRGVVIWDRHGTSHDGDYPCVFHQLKPEIRHSTATALPEFLEWLESEVAIWAGRT